MPQKITPKDDGHHIKESSNQAIKYLILILASIAIIQIFSVILIASNPQAYNQSQSPRLKAITQKILKKEEKTPNNKIISFPIESEEEAIEYAKTDPDVINYIKEYSNNGLDANIYLWGKFDSDQNIWIVIIPVFNTSDLWFEIHFRPDGTILSKTRQAGG